MRTGTGNDKQDHSKVAASATAHDFDEMVVDEHPLIIFVLPGIPESAGVARWHVGAVFKYHGLSGYAYDAKIITSELVTNAIKHASPEKIYVVLVRARNPDTIGIAVTDTSLNPPAKCEVPADSERGRGLQVIDALSWRWGWCPRAGGKAVYAILQTPPGGTRSEGSQTGDPG